MSRTGRPRVQHPIDPARPGFAQGPCRQQPAVARAAFVHHAYFEVAGQGQVLQAIVANQHLHPRVRLQQAQCRIGPGPRHPNGHARGLVDQQGFVSHVQWVAVVRHGPRVMRSASMPA